MASDVAKEPRIMVDQPSHPDSGNAESGFAQPSRGEGQRIATLLAIARTLASNRDSQTLIADLLAAVVNTFDKADASVLFLMDAKHELVVKAALRCEPAPFSRTRLAARKVIASKVLQDCQAVLYPTPEAFGDEAAASSKTADRRALRQEAADSGQPQSAIALPLVSGRTPHGVLILENVGQTSRFSQADLTFFQHVADLIAAALEQGRERERRQAAQAVKRADRLKAEMVSVLAHEMRTPLTSIKGYSTALLMEEAAFSPETQREFLEIVDEECDVLQSLIHDLLESSVIDAGGVKIEPQPVRLARLARSVIHDFSRRTRGIRFFLDFPKDFPIVDVDPERIREVLRNLLDNAVKYSPNGGLVVVRGETREKDVVVSVADQGIGIAPEHLNRLFEKFFRVNSSTGRHVVGSGLGLPIARSTVEGHGGHIWAESQAGRGSTFYFTLPLPNRTHGAIEGDSE